MKRLISVLAFLCFGFITPQIEVNNEESTSFCNGFDDGYKEGYCYQVYGCVEPIPPICPIPEIGEESYRDGYNRGFSKGRSDQ